MRRMSLFAAALVVLAAVAAPAFAQTQDPLITSARQLAQSGNHDSAIQALRSALAARPADAALKAELLSVLEMKSRALGEQLAALQREIRELRGPGTTPVRTAVPGCGTATPIRVGGNVGVPMKVRDWKPVYPELAQQGRVQGVVIIEATIDCDGNVVNPRVLRGQPLLDAAALEAVQQWRYTPVQLNGAPVPVIMTMTVTFSLR